MTSLVVASSSKQCTKQISDDVHNFIENAVVNMMGGRNPKSAKEKVVAAMCRRRFVEAFNKNIASIGTPLGLHTAMALAEKIMQVLLNSPHKAGESGNSLSAFRDLLSATKAVNHITVHAWHDSEDPVRDLQQVYEDMTRETNFFTVVKINPIDDVVTSQVVIDSDSLNVTEDDHKNLTAIVKRHAALLENFHEVFPGINILPDRAIVSISASDDLKKEATRFMTEKVKELGEDPFSASAVLERVVMNFGTSYRGRLIKLNKKPCGYVVIVTDMAKPIFEKIIGDALGENVGQYAMFTEMLEGKTQITIVSTMISLNVLRGFVTKHFSKRSLDVHPQQTFHRIAFFNMIESVQVLEDDLISVKHVTGLQTSVPNDFLRNALVASKVFAFVPDRKHLGNDVFRVLNVGCLNAIKRDSSTASVVAMLRKWHKAFVLGGSSFRKATFMYVFMRMKWDNLTVVREHPLVNYRMTISDSPKEMQMNFGMCGAEMTLINNFYAAIREMGNDILIGYVTFVVRAMTMGNNIIPMTNNGIASIAPDSLSKMNIRKVFDVALNSAIVGDVVPVKSITAAAFASTRITVGTGAITFVPPKSYQLLQRLPFGHFCASDFNSDPFAMSDVFDTRPTSETFHTSFARLFLFL